MASKSNFSFALERARLLFAAHLSAFHRRRKRINFEIDSESEKEREYNQINSGTNKLARPCFLALLLEADDDGSLILVVLFRQDFFHQPLKLDVVWPSPLLLTDAITPIFFGRNLIT